VINPASGIARPILALICCFLVALPFLSVTYPPITDLPQQTAQIRLFLDTLQNPEESPYKIHWLNVFNLSYLLLGICWGIFGPQNAGSVAMLITGILWIGSIHLLFAARSRSSVCAILASLLFFNQSVYWGLYSFVIGVPVFLLWFHVTCKQESSDSSFKEPATFILVSLLLFFCHVLWFAAGFFWLITHSLLFHREKLGKRMLYVSPMILPVAVWYEFYVAYSMATPPLWRGSPLSRITSFSWLTKTVFGGLTGYLECVTLFALIILIGIAIFRHRTELASKTDLEMLSAASMFFSFALIFPDAFMNTICFSQRWAPVGFIFLLGTFPPPVGRPLLRQVISIALVLSFCLLTSITWRTFERQEMSGLTESLDALPQKPKLLGLSIIQTSEFIRGAPFLQVFAYSQVRKSGMLNFSFANFSHCLVQFKNFSRKWTSGLEWQPARVKQTDLYHFDYVLVNGTEQIHKSMETFPALKPLTRNGRWRLYSIDHDNIRIKPRGY
jgi:hypothetical protein